MKFPDDYAPAFPDSELLLIDMIQTELDTLDPGGWAGTFLPEDGPDRIASDEALVQIHKLPGALIMNDLLHLTELTVEVVSAKRSTSWAVLQYLEDKLTEKYERGGAVPRTDGSITAIRGFGTSSTGQQLAFLNSDDRMVQNTFQLVFKRNLRK